MDFLKGFKTKIAAGGLFLLGVAAFIEGEYNEGLAMVFQSLGAFGIKMAIDRK